MIESFEEEVEELPSPGPDDGFPGDDDETETPDEEEEVVVNKNPLPVYVQILSAKECEGKTYYNAEMDCCRLLFRCTSRNWQHRNGTTCVSLVTITDKTKYPSRDKLNKKTAVPILVWLF